MSKLKTPDYLPHLIFGRSTYRRRALILLRRIRELRLGLQLMEEAALECAWENEMLRQRVAELEEGYEQSA